jgi:hypothetical protein
LQTTRRSVIGPARVLSRASANRITSGTTGHFRLNRRPALPAPFIHRAAGLPDPFDTLNPGKTLPPAKDTPS